MLNINPFYFFMAFAIGLFFVYVFQPPPDVVIKFPSPYNAGKVVYKDKQDACYKYEAQEVSCDNERVKIQPIMEDFVNKKI